MKKLLLAVLIAAAFMAAFSTLPITNSVAFESAPDGADPCQGMPGGPSGSSGGPMNGDCGQLMDLILKSACKDKPGPGGPDPDPDTNFCPDKKSDSNDGNTPPLPDPTNSGTDCPPSLGDLHTGTPGPGGPDPAPPYGAAPRKSKKASARHKSNSRTKKRSGSKRSKKSRKGSKQKAGIASIRGGSQGQTSIPIDSVTRDVGPCGPSPVNETPGSTDPEPPTSDCGPGSTSAVADPGGVAPADDGEHVYDDGSPVNPPEPDGDPGSDTSDPPTPTPTPTPTPETSGGKEPHDPPTNGNGSGTGSGTTGGSSGGGSSSDGSGGSSGGRVPSSDPCGNNSSGSGGSGGFSEGGGGSGGKNHLPLGLIGNVPSTVVIWGGEIVVAVLCPECEAAVLALEWLKNATAVVNALDLITGGDIPLAPHMHLPPLMTEGNRDKGKDKPKVDVSAEGYDPKTMGPPDMPPEADGFDEDFNTPAWKTYYEKWRLWEKYKNEYFGGKTPPKPGPGPK